MNLRPHHILCIQKFTGHGYNGDFTAHMTEVVSALKEGTKATVAVTRGCDELCRKCPHNGNGVCTSGEKVEAMDRKVLKACGISYGERILWAELKQRARDRVFGTDEFRKICDRCQWFELCRKTEVSNESFDTNEKQR